MTTAIEWVVDCAAALGMRADVLPILAGCSPANADCALCWAAEVADRRGCQSNTKILARYGGLTRRTGDGRAVFTGEVRLLPAGFHRAEAARHPTVYFVASESDLAHERVPLDFARRVVALAGARPDHRLILVTKRPARLAAVLADAVPRANVIVLCTAGHQAAADTFRPAMERLAAAGWLTGVSSEPRREPIDWTGWGFIAWLITGAESGAKARRRRMDPDWTRADRDFAARIGAAFYLKQAEIGGRIVSRPALDGRQHLAVPTVWLGLAQPQHVAPAAG